MFVDMRKFIISNRMEPNIHQASIETASLIEASCKQWYKSHRYKNSHKEMPKDLTLMSKNTEMGFCHLISQCCPA